MLWLALDGVGHPDFAPAGSPWQQDLPAFSALRRHHDAHLDASLGVEGLPQSGTGQTSWLTGRNAAQQMKRHYGPYPGPSLQSMLANCWLLQSVQQGHQWALLNSYPEQYLAQNLARLATGRRSRYQFGCIPWVFWQAGLNFNPKGLPLLDVTLRSYSLSELPKMGYQLARASRALDGAVLDLWYSDTLGHRQDEAAALSYLAKLDALLAGILDAGVTVVIGSDHGNFEDLSVRTHTYAPVPWWVVGSMPPVGLSNIAQAGAWLAGVYGITVL